ncbi:MAG: hypothetical protein ACREM1_06300 [Longimicrobiales bacterium]
MERFVGLLIAAVVVATLLASGGLLVARRVLPLQLFESHNPVLGHVFSVVSVLSGIVIAFMVVAVWERYTEAWDIAEHEAIALVDLFRNAVAFPDPERKQLQDRIRRYAVAVKTDEWPAMAGGGTSQEALRAYNAIWREYLSLSPRTERERLWLEWSIERLDALDDQRNLRLIRSRVGLPAPMWVTLYVLSAVMLAFSYFFGISTLRVHLIVSGAIAAGLALLLTLIWALQHPFGTVAPIPPDALRDALTVFEQPPR